MTVTVDNVADYIGVLPTDPLVAGLLSTATVMVDEDLTPSGKAKVPPEIYDQAVLMAADQLYRRRNSPGGISQWAPDGSTPIFMPNDILRPIRPLYARYRPMGVVK